MLIEAATIWKPIRKIMNPAFSQKTLNSYMPIFVQETKDLLKTLELKRDGEGFDILPLMNICALKMICGK